MDPLSAVSLVGTAITLVDFLIKLTSTAYRLSRDADQKPLAEIKTAAQELSINTGKLKASLQDSDNGFSADERDVIRRVYIESDAVLSRLKGLLDKSTTRKNGRTPKAAEIARLTILSMWNKHEIEDLRSRLRELQRSIDSTLLQAAYRHLLNADLGNSRLLDSMEKSTKQIMHALISQNNALKDFESRIVALTQLINRFEGSALANRFSIQDPQGNYQSPVENNEDIIRKQATDAILESLWFESASERQKQIPRAHKETFEWIFRPPHQAQQRETGQGRLWSDFSDWLRNGDGLYWISGKPGSGKSTLMKYLASHPSAESHLSKWSGTSRLLKASFFFWNSGSREQMSQEGLFKSILHAILNEAPELVPVVFPSEWSKRYVTKLQSSWSFRPKFSWDLDDLESAFKLLIEQKIVPLKIFLLLDGLDEYEGDDYKIADLVMDAAKSPNHNIKICASSRPHNAFEDKFCDSPRLRLQDLTHPDIAAYVSDVLLKAKRMERVTRRDPEEAQNLANCIVNEASGVFLWVKLVVASLLRGLGERDSVRKLRERLNELPKDLNQLYEHMICKAAEDYQQEASRLFQLVAMRSDLAMSPLRLIEAALVEEELPGEMTSQNVEDACEQMAAAVVSWSGGLLEVENFGIDDDNKDQLAHQQIIYIHRTVKDFMRQDKIRLVLSKRTAVGTDMLAFNPVSALLKSAIVRVKFYAQAVHPQFQHDLLPYSWDSQGWDESCLNGIEYCILIDGDMKVAPRFDLMDQFFLTARQTVHHLPTDNILGVAPMIRRLRSALHFAAQFGLVRYMATKLPSLDADEEVKRKTQTEINEALWIAKRPFNETPVSSPLTIYILLEHGADPNWQWSDLAGTAFDNLGRRSERVVPSWQRAVHTQTDKDLEKAREKARRQAWNILQKKPVTVSRRMRAVDVLKGAGLTESEIVRLLQESQQHRHQQR